MVHALDGRLGIAKWNFKTGDAVWSSPAIGNNGNLYIGSNDNKIYKIAGNSHGPANSPWAMYGRSAQRTGADRNLAKIVPPKKPRALTKFTKSDAPKRLGLGGGKQNRGRLEQWPGPAD